MKKARYLFFILIFILGNFGGTPIFALENPIDAEEILEEEVEDDEDSSEEEGGDEEEGEKDLELEEQSKTIVIRAVNAGTNEFIELTRLSDEPLEVSGMSIVYTNNKGNSTTIYTFDENIILIGKNIVFGYEKAGQVESSDLQYGGSGLSKTAGKVSLEMDEIEFDSVCWGKQSDCENTTALNDLTLVRDLKTFESTYSNEYIPEWEKGREVIKILEDEDETDEEEEKEEKEIEEPTELEEILPVCAGLEFSELFSYFINDRSEQFIEIYNPTDEEISLEGCSIRYKNKSYELEGVIQAGEFFVIFPEEIELSLTKNPTKSNLLELVDTDGSVVDSLEYYNGQKKGVAFAQFGVSEDKTENWDFTRVLTPGKKNEKEKTTEKKNEDEVIEPVCKGIQFSEILSFYETEKSEQFIELYNPTAIQITLNGCSLKYKNKYYDLFGVLKPEGYFVYYPTGFSLTKNPVSSNLLELIDTDGSVVDSLAYYNGQKKGVAFAQFGYGADGKELWEQTYAPTPWEENNYQKYKPCPEGKVLNEETGNCVKAITLSTSLKACPEGWYRNPLTNRCKKISTTSSSLKDCPEGYERNPETNRCRKIVKNEGAKYGVAEEKFEEKSTFLASTAIIIIGSVGVIYIIFEYRKELAGIFKKKK